MMLLMFIILLVIIAIINAFQPKYNAILYKRVVSNNANNRNGMSIMMAKEEDSISRRRNRRKRSDNKIAIETNDSNNSNSNNSNSNNSNSSNNNNIKNDDNAFMDKNKDVSMEDMFGLGNEQLRELLEQELPIPREDLITGKAIKAEESDKNKVFKLLDLDEFIKETSGKNAEDAKAKKEMEDAERIDRSNPDEYLRVLQLNPFADADETMFLNEYDIIPSIFGSGKLLGVPVPYLQTGHGILLLTTLLAGFVYAPGNPLTEFPLEIRNFLKSGLTVTYAINSVLAVLAFFNAKSKNLPSLFWFFKTFLLGGVAYYEITQSKDPRKLNVKEDGRLEENNRASKRRRDRA